MKCYIYFIINQETNQRYVGQTTNFSRRKSEHLTKLRENRHPNLKLQNEEVSDVKWFAKEEVLERLNNNYMDLTEKIGCWDYLKRYYKWKENN